MNSTKGVRVVLAEGLRVADFLIAFVFKPLGVARGKFHARQKIKNRRIVHLSFLESRPTTDQCHITEIGNRAAFVNAGGERRDLRPAKVAIDVRNVQADTEARREIVARDKVRDRTVHEGRLEKW